MYMYMYNNVHIVVAALYGRWNYYVGSIVIQICCLATSKKYMYMYMHMLLHTYSYYIAHTCAYTYISVLPSFVKQICMTRYIHNIILSSRCKK